MRKIVITGGAGFIGSHFAESLCDRKDVDIVLFDSFRRDSLAYALQLKSHKNVSVVSGDVQNADVVSSCFAGADMVFHLAAIAGVSSYYSEPLKTLQTNILGTVNVLEQAVKQKVRSVIHFSTSEIYGSSAMWVKETDACGIGPSSDKRWVYATSKLAGENFALRYGEQHGFDVAVLRPFNIYGPRQVGEGAISNFCRAVASGAPMMVYGDGSAIRAWCYIDDFVTVLNRLLEGVPKEAQVFNIGNDQEVETTVGLARRIKRLVPGSKIDFKEGVHAEVRARVPCIDRAKELLGYKPAVDLDQGLLKTIEWFKQIAKEEVKSVQK